MKRGQVSIEYIMITGLLLLVTIPLFAYAFIEVNRSVQMNHAEDAVNTLANAADTVYSLGPGSKKYVWITTPGGVTQSCAGLVEGSLTCTNSKEVSMKMYIFGGESDVFAKTKPTVIGSIPTAKGSHRIAVESLGSGVVRIGEAPVDAELPLITRIYPDVESGEKICSGIITVGADTNEPTVCRYFRDEDYVGKDDWQLWEDEGNEFEGRALSHYITEHHNEGIYSYYARCEDYSDNVMSYKSPPFDPPTSEELPTVKTVNITFEIKYCEEAGVGVCGPEDPEDYEDPIVTSEGPGNGDIKTYPLVEFNYTVTDQPTDQPSEIDYCVLNISRATGTAPNYQPGDSYTSVYDFDPVQTTNPQNKLNNSIEFAFGEKGMFIWNVFCIDSNCRQNKGISEDRVINVSKTFYEAFLTSCAGWCGFNGYVNGGVCDNNKNKCLETCSPPLGFDPTYTCWAGDVVSDQYCLPSGTESDECCCLP